MSTDGLAARVLTLVGGPGNVAQLTHCYSRLRFALHDDAAADEAALGALPEVAIVIRQGGQLHVALRSGVVAVHDELVGLLG
ncbi:MAG: PTS transporter subunit EIIB [Cellulomonadaceae bacterium]|nr:PTS transporter subunit EIIB [Cellulomonadaceae bacterium]